ncbi:MAG: hypothetical protein LBM01_00120 [Christensenellaceae bacterium]|jgi:hypothetical protein|nr:hypothetical protein [Christensenellaceae bacterium]
MDYKEFFIKNSDVDPKEFFKAYPKLGKKEYQEAQNYAANAQYIENKVVVGCGSLLGIGLIVGSVIGANCCSGNEFEQDELTTPPAIGYNMEAPKEYNGIKKTISFEAAQKLQELDIETCGLKAEIDSLLEETGALINNLER